MDGETVVLPGELSGRLEVLPGALLRGSLAGVEEVTAGVSADTTLF